MPFAILLCLLSGCSEPHSQIERIQERGVLEVLTRNSPTSYFLGPDGATGMEYELAARFADHLGVELSITVPLGAGDIIPMLRHDRADMAVAGLAVTELRREQVRFGPPYMQIRQQLVYRSGETRPADITDLNGKLGVVAGSAEEERLRQLRDEFASLDWLALADKTQLELMDSVARGELDYAVVNSNELAYARRYYPDIALAFDLSEDLDVAWAFQSGPDDSLYRAAREFFRALERADVIAAMKERYYGHTRQYDYIDARTFLTRLQDRLPDYRQHFMDAAAITAFDWQLLAAIGYQESHWEPEAISPTGVRGIMMLTQDTAKRVGIEDRTDARQSIMGGALYLREVIEKLPERIPMPDRMWLALAAYNIGFGHLEDARRLTQSQGGDPDRWRDVREHLPLLSDPDWSGQTRHGSARGHEAVQFVSNIRRYHDALTWLYRKDTPGILPPPQVQSPVL